MLIQLLVSLSYQTTQKIKQTSDLVNAILRGSLGFGYCRKELVLGKTSGNNLIFWSDKSRKDQYLEGAEFFDVENKKLKNVHIYSAYEELNNWGLKVKQQLKVFNKIFKRRKGRFYG